MLIKNNLPTEITRLLEAGVNKHLNRSILYSPLRYFYNKFKRNNPRIIENARNTVASDISDLLKQIPEFNESAFVADGQATEVGKKFFKRIYNIGINLLKKNLKMRQAFRVLTNSSFRMQIYNFILKSVRKAAIEFVKQGKIEQ